MSLQELACFALFTTSYFKSNAILNQLYHNICGHKILDELDYEIDLISMSRVMGRWIIKNDTTFFTPISSPILMLVIRNVYDLDL